MPDPSLDAIQDPQRLGALQKTGLLDTAPEPSFDRFTQLAVDLLGVRASLISLVGSDRQFIKSSAGLGELGVTEEHQHLSLPHSFAQRVVTTGEPLVISDAREDDRLEDTIDADEVGIVAYAAFPLRTTEEGHILGAFCALSDAPHDWTDKEIGVLEGLSNAIVARIELQEAKEDAERSRREAEAAREQAEAASAAKSRFVANMSHELRTPLNSIIGYSEMFMEEPLDWNEERLRDGMKRIYNSGQQLLELINDVLNLSKAEAGRLSLSLSTFELYPLVEQVVEEVRPRLEEHGNHFELEGLEEMQEVCTDKSKVRQILRNLLSNAAKYTHDGTVTLRVHLHERSEPPRSSQPQAGGEGEEEPCEPEAAHHELVLEVADTGIGMTEEEQEKLFEAFERAEDAEQTGGTGLGLGIVQNLCHLLDGSVEVESQKGAGSTFTARIPLKASEGPSPDRAHPFVEEHRPSPSTLPPRRDDLVLVIDDDRDARILLRNHLSAAGFEVETASNGTEGIEQAHELHPVAITLDVRMGDMDGWEVLNRLKDDDQTRHIPVIMVSITPDRGRGFQLGATEHLVKPVDRDRLTELLQQYRSRDVPTFSVLVIEDDHATRDVVQQVIEEEADYEVHTASRAQEALDLLTEGLSPNLILLDLMMPGLNGFEFLEAAREHIQQVPVVVLTDEELTEEDVQRLNGQVDQIIQKKEGSNEELLRELQQRMSTLSHKQTSAPPPATS